MKKVTDIRTKLGHKKIENPLDDFPIPMDYSTPSRGDSAGKVLVRGGNVSEHCGICSGAGRDLYDKELKDLIGYVRFEKIPNCTLEVLDRKHEKHVFDLPHWVTFNVEGVNACKEFETSLCAATDCFSEDMEKNAPNAVPEEHVFTEPKEPPEEETAVTYYDAWGRSRGTMSVTRRYFPGYSQMNAYVGIEGLYEDIDYYIYDACFGMKPPEDGAVRIVDSDGKEHIFTRAQDLTIFVHSADDAAQISEAFTYVSRKILSWLKKLKDEWSLAAIRSIFSDDTKGEHQ